ncbi:MAG: gamma-glutamylcyclotransferase [Alphaproteobacteria bacterium]|nr:gamma-glutamylcyclotransferase [Alphaproteobacteria bacterium]
MTQKSSDAAPPPLRASGPDGQLARQDFTPERIAAYAQLAKQFGDAQFLSEEEREKSRAEIMAQHVAGADLWVFGYGSLMWNPAIQVAESLPARIEGFSRSFCMRLMFGRGMPDNPGLMLCLVPGGACSGIAHRIAPEHVESESKILWMREMLSGAYVPTWVDLDLGARHVRGVTFVINMAHPRYLPGLSLDEKAARIAKAEGHLGTNRDYLFRTVAALTSAGVSDTYLDDIHARVRALTDHTP